MRNREEQLWDYLEGRLTGNEKTALEKWLAAAPGNRRQLEEITVLNDALHSMEADAPSLRFAARVMEAWEPELALRTAPLETRTDKRIVYAIGTLLAGALLLTLGLFLFLPGGGSEGRLVPESELIGIGDALSKFLAGFGKYAVGLITLLSMILVERYLHYRHYLRTENPVH